MTDLSGGLPCSVPVCWSSSNCWYIYMNRQSLLQPTEWPNQTCRKYQNYIKAGHVFRIRIINNATLNLDRPCHTIISPFYNHILWWMCTSFIPYFSISETITDFIFHPEADLIAIGNISGELSVFNYTNEATTVQKKLKLSKKTLRGLEFDDTSLTITGHSFASRY